MLQTRYLNNPVHFAASCQVEEVCFVLRLLLASLKKLEEAFLEDMLSTVGTFQELGWAMDGLYLEFEVELLATRKGVDGLDYLLIFRGVMDI